MKKRLILLFAPIVFGFLLASLPAIVYQMVVPVNTVKPEAITYQKTLSYTGQVESVETREIYLETAAIPAEVFVEPGTYVQKGEVLAKIDTKLTKTVLAQGISSLEETQTEKEKKLLEQYGKAYGLTDEETAQVFHTESAASFVQRSDSEIFVPSEVVSPMNGIITQVHLFADTLYSPNKAAIVVNSAEGCKIVIQLKQNDVDAVQIGTKALVKGEGLNGKTYRASVQKIFPTAQKEYNGFTSETVIQTELLVEDWDEDLKSGYSVQVILMPEEPEEYFSLPYEAICQDENNLEYVWVVQNGKAVRRDIITGEELPEVIEIRSGLSFADNVILSPSEIKENQWVHAQTGGLYD